jgi:hypothetical protein
MKVRFSMIAMAVFMALSASALAEEWKDVPMVDTMCSTKAKAKADEHPRSCALQCQASGFGIVTPDGTYLKFDAEGNTQAIAALKASKKTDHLRVNVSGQREGDTIKVKSLTM